jgi:hypothetical protein
MAYFYVSRTRPPRPFSSTVLMAGVIEANDITGAHEQFAATLKPLTDSKMGDPADFSIDALDGVERSEHGFVMATFTQR